MTHATTVWHVNTYAQIIFVDDIYSEEKQDPNARDHYRPWLKRYLSVVQLKYCKILHDTKRSVYMLQIVLKGLRSSRRHTTLWKIGMEKLLKIKKEFKYVIREMILLDILLQAYSINSTICVIPVPTFQFHLRDRNATCNHFHYDRLQR